MACGFRTRINLSMNVTEIAVPVIVLCIIVALFSLPIVFYYVSVSISLNCYINTIRTDKQSHTLYIRKLVSPVSRYNQLYISTFYFYYYIRVVNVYLTFRDHSIIIICY